jgi:uncharacterized RDD family membrane protein YckC
MVERVDWYYADRTRQPVGPLTREALIAAVRRGDVVAETPIWRTGWPEWKPFSACAGELGLADVVAGDPTLMPSTAAETPVVYAGFLRRWGALIIDGFALMIPLGVICIVLAVALGMSQGAHGISTAQGAYYVLWLIAVPLYYAVQESSRYQATLGKRALGIKVTDLDGRRIGFGHALGRWFAAVLSYLTFYVGFFMAGFTVRKQALHDYVANTLVVDQWAYSDSPELQQRSAGGCAIALAIGFAVMAFFAVFGILAAIAIPAYQDYALRARVATATAAGDRLKSAIAEQVIVGNACPENGQDGIGTQESYATASIASIRVGRMDERGCGLDITLRNPSARLDGKHVWLTLPDAATASTPWRCESDVEIRYRPMQCRD